MLAKQKKREKKEKRKAREAALAAGIPEDYLPTLVAKDNEDPLALLASLPLAEEEEEEEEERPSKRPKKWFEDDSGDEKKVGKRRDQLIEAEDEPETLEDLEALAAGLLT